MYSTPSRRNIFLSTRCSLCGGELIPKGNGYYACEQCNDLSQDNLSKIRQFLIDEPAATIDDICKQFSFKYEYVKHFYDTGELSAEALESSKRYCQRCHALINFGRYCDKCKNSVANDLRNAFR